jgi:cation transport regulator ChaC
VFGYASLVQRPDGGPRRLRPAVLRGYRRKWNVAMDNSVTLSDYKYYVDPMTGKRPRCFVVFLNIVADDSASVNGALFGVTEDELEALDRRERNYTRIEVSSQLAERTAGRVWTYVGRSAAVRRFEAARRLDRGVIQAAYRDEVRQGFAALGDGAAAEFERLTDPSLCPIVALARVSTARRS